MTMMIRRWLIVCVSVFVGFCGYTQEKDFGIWFGAAAETDIVKKLELDLSGCLRTFENASQIEEAFLETGLMYKLCKYFSVGGAYRITRSIEDDDSYHIRHKWFADIKGTLPAGDFKFTGRVRFQERYKTYFEDENDKKATSHIRGRLKAQYDIPSFPVNPYLAAELFFPVQSQAEMNIDKKRFMAGIEYNISKIHSVALEYLFQRDYHPKLIDMNIISLNYNLKF